MTDAELAADIAVQAGTVLLALQRSRACDRAMGLEGDGAANVLILDRLRTERPTDPILSEESEDDPARCASRRLWVVDPLDGTAEFASGRDDWAVHVGLSIDGIAAAGAVALPARGLVLRSDTVSPPPPSGALPRVVVSRSRAPKAAVRVAEAIGGTLAPMGSAGAKAMAVVLGEADVYLHSGGQYAWDNCAPAAVALAAGLHVSRLDGTPLVYNCVETWLPDLLICRRELAPAVLAITRGG